MEWFLDFLPSLLAVARGRLHGDGDFDPTFPIILVGLAIVAVIILKMDDAIKRGSEKTDMEELNRQNIVEADALFKDVRRRKYLTTVDVNVILECGEAAFRVEPSKLFETRAVRVYGDTGTRLYGVYYIDGGASESYQRLRELDSGLIILTNKRLVFDGTSEKHAVTLADIISVQCWADAIEVHTSRRPKSQVYTVANPFIWKGLIDVLATRPDA
jgi:hypothetical protein